MRLIFRPLAAFTKYKVPYNINFEQHKPYLKKVERSQEQLAQNQKIQLIPRRKRRIYDRPKFDTNIQKYGAWRTYQVQQWIEKPHEHSMQVILKMNIAPKWVIHAFGAGCLPWSNPRSSHRQFHFEDNQLNRFILYQYRNTTDFKQNVPGYDYEHQEHLHPRLRISKRVSPEEFWLSEEPKQFRVNGTVYAERFKFQQWVLREIQRKKTEKSYDQYIDEKFGKVITFNKKEDAPKFEANKPMVTSVTPQMFNPPKKSKKQPEPPKSTVGKMMDQKFRVKQKITSVPQQDKIQANKSK